VTVAELIEKLKAFPEDKQVLVERGEWGPCLITSEPWQAIVRESSDTTQWWEIYDAEYISDDEGDRPRHNVVIV
jgi:hypothetical protein